MQGPQGRRCPPLLQSGGGLCHLIASGARREVRVNQTGPRQGVRRCLYQTVRSCKGGGGAGRRGRGMRGWARLFRGHPVEERNRSPRLWLRGRSRLVLSAAAVTLIVTVEIPRLD